MSTIVETEKLLDAVTAALIGSIGVTLAFSLLILGTARFNELRRSGHAVAAAGYGVLALVGLAGCLAGVAIGLTYMIKK